MHGSFSRLLRPRSIAVVGGREAERVVAQLDRIGFTGEVWPVNPHRERIGQRRVFPDVASLPGIPDAAFVGVNRERSVGVVASLAAQGAGGAVCYASGFLEAVDATHDGASLQQALLDAAGAMPVIGPNCYGFINYADRVALWPDAFAGRPLGVEERGVAIVSQSSNLALNIDGQRRGLPIACVLTVGNQARVSLVDLAVTAIEDPRVSAVGAYLEGTPDLASLEQLATLARTRRKPLVMLKAGRTALAQEVALTHTASLSGDDTVFDALLARLGIARVDDLETFIETLKLMHVHGALPGFDIASLSCSGGEAVLMADAVRKTRLQLRPLEPTQVTALRDVLGPLVNVTNPLDYHTFAWGDAPRLEATFDAMLRVPFDLAVLVIDLPREDRCDDTQWWVSIDAFTRSAERAGQRAAVVATLPENLPEPAADRLIARGVTPLCGLDAALRAAEAAATVGNVWTDAPPAPLLCPAPACGAIRTLDEDAGKRLLAQSGLHTPQGVRADRVDTAVAAARRLGFPIAMKVLGIAHKTESGAVRLGLDDDDAVAQAAAALLRHGRTLLVEPMVDDGVAEFLIGARRTGFGAIALTLASGGTLAELVADSVTLLLPVEEVPVRSALRSLRAWRLLEGHRGSAAGDADAVVDAVMATARFVAANAAVLEELDVNPLIARPQGCGATAVDALVRLREA